MSRVLFSIVFLCFFGALLAEEPAEEEPEPTGLASLHLPSELTLSDSFIRAVGTAGALVTGIAGIAAILSFVLPLFGFRTCAFFGGCGDATYDTTAYSPNIATNSVYDQQGYTGYQYGNNAFRKRSLEYVGPILKMLTAAYDKYGPKPKAMKAPEPAGQ